MFLYKSSLIRIFAAAVAVSSCNETTFQASPVATKLAPQSADVDPVVETPPPPTVLEPVVEVLPPAPPPEPILGDITLPDTQLPIPEKIPVTRKEVVEVQEHFTQLGLPGTADIAIVIDDSGSMDQEQLNLSTKLGDLLVALKDTSWQIGVVTTSPKVENGRDLCQLKLIKSTDTDVEAKFKEAVTPGITGLGEEQGVRQAVNALKCPEQPWVRSDSTVAVLIVSDEDNCSQDGADCGTNPWAKENYLIDFVEKDLKRTIGRNAGFYGIIAPTVEKCDTALNRSTQYERLINYKAGANVNYGNICDASYKTTLERISKNIAKLLSSKFTLMQMPDLGSASISGVKANGDPITASDYTISGNSLVFKIGSEPALGSDIVLNYKVSTIITE